MTTKLTKGEKGKKAITFFQQHNFRVVQLEFDKWRSLSEMIPNNLLQHPMSGKPTWLPGYQHMMQIRKDGTYFSIFTEVIYQNRHPTKNIWPLPVPSHMNGTLLKYIYQLKQEEFSDSPDDGG